METPQDPNEPTPQPTPPETPTEAAIPADPTLEPTAPAPAPAPPRRRMLPWLIALAVFVAAGLGVGAWLLLSGPKKAATPEEALRGFYTAVAEDDCEAAASYLDPSFQTQEQVCKDLGQIKEQVGTLGEIRSVDDQGNVAYVVASRTVEGQADQRIITVKKGPEEGWLVAGGSACYGVEQPEDLGNDHLEEGETFDAYSSDPPTSGPHAPSPTETGQIYSEPQPDAELVHAMEHGAVVFWMSFQDEALREQAQGAIDDVFTQGYESLIVTPKPDLDVPFAMTAWGALQKCVGVDPQDIQTFVENHYGSGLEGSLACYGEASSLPGCNRS